MNLISEKGGSLRLFLNPGKGLYLQGRVKISTGGKVRARKLTRWDSGTNGKVRMKEDMTSAS